MNAETFEHTLRQFLSHQPFEPFVVELLDGRQIEVDQPKVVFAGGAASFFTPNYDLIEFSCEEISTIRPLVSGTAP